VRGPHRRARFTLGWMGNSSVVKHTFVHPLGAQHREGEIVPYPFGAGAGVECQDLQLLGRDIHKFTLQFRHDPSAWVSYSGYTCQYWFHQNACSANGAEPDATAEKYGKMQEEWNGLLVELEGAAVTRPHVAGSHRRRGDGAAAQRHAHPGNVCCACGGGTTSQQRPQKKEQSELPRTVKHVLFASPVRE
jgi:hypothetical protein